MTTDDSPSDVHSQWRSSTWWNALKLTSQSPHLFFTFHPTSIFSSAELAQGCTDDWKCWLNDRNCVQYYLQYNSSSDWLSWYVTIAHTRSCLTVSGLLKSSLILFPPLLSLSRDAAFMWDSVTCGNVSDLPSPSTIPSGNTRPEQSKRMCSSNMNAKNTYKTNNMLSC